MLQTVVLQIGLKMRSLETENKMRPRWAQVDNGNH